MAHGHPHRHLPLSPCCCHEHSPPVTSKMRKILTGPWSLLQAKAKVPDDVTEQVNHAGQDARAYRAPSWRTCSKDSHVKHFPPHHSLERIRMLRFLIQKNKQKSHYYVSPFMFRQNGGLVLRRKCQRSCILYCSFNLKARLSIGDNNT